MTQKTINEQIEVIRRVGEEVLKSKESARQFLIDAGLIKGEKKNTKKASNYK